MFESKSSYNLDDYRKLYPLQMKASWIESKIGLPVITGEASQYLSYEEVPVRIKAFFPEMKFIVLLRDPTSRAYSHFNMRKRYGWEKQSFIEAFHRENEGDGMKGGSTYKFRGLYAKHLRWWFNQYSRDNFLVFDSSNVRSNPEHVYDKVCDFLGIEKHTIPKKIESNVGNYKKLDNDAMSLWKEYFHPYNEDLFELMNTDYGWND